MIILYVDKKHYALSHANQTVSVVEVTMSGSEIASEITADMLWNYQDQKLSYVDGGATCYLYVEGTGPKITVKVDTANATAIAFDSNRLKIGDQYLRYAGGKFKVERNASTTYLYVQS